MLAEPRPPLVPVDLTEFGWVLTGSGMRDVECSAPGNPSQLVFAALLSRALPWGEERGSKRPHWGLGSRWSFEALGEGIGLLCTPGAPAEWRDLRRGCFS